MLSLRSLMPANRPFLWVLLFFSALMMAKYAPVILGDLTIAHGDATNVSLPLQRVLAVALENDRFPLWSNLLYGGHPLFAEGQGGFAHPLNLLLFGFFPLLFAHNLFHFICSLLMALGSYALCRALEFGRLASVVGGLAFGCSHIAMSTTHNAPVAGTLAWAPLAVAMMESWWKNPTRRNALAFAIAVALMVLGGYQQIVYGTLLFMAALLLSRVLSREFLRHPERLGVYLRSGSLAVTTTLGLTAVQMLPLLELTENSIRAQGVGLLFATHLDSFYRGFFFSIQGPGSSANIGLGSILVASLGAVVVFLRPKRLIWGYVLATWLLIDLGTAENSAIYLFFRESVPGIDKFRSALVFMNVGLMGVSVLAGATVNKLQEGVSLTLARKAGVLAAVVAVFGTALYLRNDVVSPLFFVFAAVAWAGLLVGVAFNKGHWGVLWVIGVIVVESLSFRLCLDAYIDRKVFQSPPEIVEYLKQKHPAGFDFKIANLSTSIHKLIQTAFLSDPAVMTTAIEEYSASLEPNTNLIWQVPSIHGGLAIPMSRSGDRRVKKLIERELKGRSPRSPGSRLIDLVGVRYVILNKYQTLAPTRTDLVEVFRSKRHRLFENRHYRPRFRFYEDYLQVRSWEEAFALFLKPEPVRQSGRLILESREVLKAPAADRARKGRATIETIKTSPELYEVRVNAPRSGYLFLADAPYRGWQAEVDGVIVPLYAANLLGKALPVPAGNHLVRLSFEAPSFWLGLWISLGTLIMFVLLWVRGPGLAGQDQQ